MTSLSKFVKIRQRFIDNKSFLLQIKEANSKDRRKLLKNSNGKQLAIIKDLVKNVVEKNVPISKETLKKLEKSGKVKFLLRKFKKTSDVYKDKKKLRSAIIQLNDILPLFILSLIK